MCLVDKNPLSKLQPSDTSTSRAFIELLSFFSQHFVTLRFEILAATAKNRVNSIDSFHLIIRVAVAVTSPSFHTQ